MVKTRDCHASPSLCSGLWLTAITPTVWAGTSPAPTIIAKCSGEVYPRLRQVVFGFCHLGFNIWVLFAIWILTPGFLRGSGSTNELLTRKSIALYSYPV